MDMFDNDICKNCQNEPYDECGANFEQITFDAVTRKVVDCDLYKEKKKHHLKITYECEGKIAVVEKDVFDLPDVKWKKAKAAGYGEFENVFLSDEELEKLKRDVPGYEEYIEALSGYIKSTGKKYKSHYATIRNWSRREKKENSKGKLQAKPSYNMNEIKRRALENTEI